MRSLTTVALRDLVPDSIRDKPEIDAAIRAIAGELGEVASITDLPAIYARLDELDGDVLDHMAWQFSAVTWRDEWPVNLKRSVIRSIIREQSAKGTAYAVRRAVESYGSDVIITEWWEQDPPGKPHTFNLTVNVATLDGELTSAEIQSDIINRVRDVKPVRSQFTFNLATQTEGAVGIAGGMKITNAIWIDATDEGQ